MGIRLLCIGSLLVQLSGCGEVTIASPATDSNRVQPKAAATKVPVYRFAKYAGGAYFYTGNEVEAQYIRTLKPSRFFGWQTLKTALTFTQVV
jgi:hypothetical protein